MDIGAATMENNTEGPQKKFKIKLLYNPATTLLSMYTKEEKTLTQKDMSHPHVHCSVIYNSQDMETS